MRKKLFIILLALSTFSLCACGKTPDTEVDKEPATVTEAPEEKEEQNNDKEKDTLDEDKEPEETEQPTETPVAEEKKYGEDDYSNLFFDASLKPENQMFRYEGRSARYSADKDGNATESYVETFSGENAYWYCYSKYDTISNYFKEDGSGDIETERTGYEVYAIDTKTMAEGFDEDYKYQISYNNNVYAKGYVTDEYGNVTMDVWRPWEILYNGYYPYWIDTRSYWPLENPKVSYSDDEIYVIANGEGKVLRDWFYEHEFPTAQFLAFAFGGKDSKLVITFSKDLVLKSILITTKTNTYEDGSSTTYEFNMTFTPITEPQFTPPAELLAVMGE